MSTDRYVTCIRCGYAVTFFEHTQLRAAVDCPRCHTTDQFGPGVYVEDFEGYSLQEVLQQKARKAPIPAGSAV